MHNEILVLVAVILAALICIGIAGHTIAQQDTQDELAEFRRAMRELQETMVKEVEPVLRRFNDALIRWGKGK